MKKTLIRKLNLHRETLRSLQPAELDLVAAGALNTKQDMTGCACTVGCHGGTTGTGTGGRTITQTLQDLHCCTN
ncbi:MAG: class I lanthipeptide [Acidobacteriota bacterium]|nr:class I lanthipeptide [Acidobacteriota bacterium]